MQSSAMQLRQRTTSEFSAGERSDRLVKDSVAFSLPTVHVMPAEPLSPSSLPPDIPKGRDSNGGNPVNPVVSGIHAINIKLDQLMQEQAGLRHEVSSMMHNFHALVSSSTVSGPLKQKSRPQTPSQHNRSQRAATLAGLPGHMLSSRSLLQAAYRPPVQSLRSNSAELHGFDGGTTSHAITSHGIDRYGDLRAVDAASVCGSNGAPGQLPATQWPTGILIRKELEQAATADHMTSVSSLIARQTVLDSKEEPRKRKQHKCACEPLDPDNLFVTLFDVLTSVVLVHDLILTPYVAVFDEESPMIANMTLFAAAFWTLDFILGFCIGYHNKGELVSDWSAIVKNYVASWCVPNLAILAFDYTSILSTAGNDTRLLKMLRLIKVFRLVRLLRLVDKISVWCALSRRGRTALQVLKLISGVLTYNHFVACVWLFIGTNAASDTGGHWLDYMVSGSIPLSELSDRYQYVTALHWTIAQMTPGPIDIVAVNTIEQVFNNVVLVCGLFFGSLIVSLCSGQIMQLVIAQRDATMKMEALEKLLHTNAVHPRLALRVKRQVMEKMSEAMHVQEDSVKALHDLSSHLRLQLMCATRKPHLLRHPLYRIWEEVDPTSFSQLCGEAVSFDHLTLEDELFLVTDEALFAYFIIDGAFVYRQSPEFAKVEHEEEVSTGAKVWVCEAVLWSHWTHVGDMIATTSSQLLTVDADQFLKVISKKSAVTEIAKQYGRQFHLRIISAIPPHAHWPSDLEVPFTGGHYANDLITHEVGLGLYNRAKAELRSKISDELLHSLEQELKQEKCTLNVDPNGQLERVVTVVTLKIFQEDGAFLAQLGRCGGSSGLKFSCELPGTKRCMSELPQVSLQKVLDRELKAISPFIELLDTQHETVTKESPKYGMNTRYIRTIHEARLLQDCSWDDTLIIYGSKSEKHGQNSARENMLATPTMAASASQSPSPRRLTKGSDKAERASLHSLKSTGSPHRTSPSAPIRSDTIYLLRHDQMAHVYAFLSEEEYKLYTDATEAERLKSWVEGLLQSVDLEVDLTEKRWFGDC